MLIISIMSHSALKKKDDDLEDVPLEQPSPIIGVEEDVDFDTAPIKRLCPYCNQKVITFVEEEMHPLFFMMALFSLIIFGLLSFILLPLAFLLTKSAIHRCSRCLQRIGMRQCYGLPKSVEDDVWQFRFGKCAVVMARLYAIILLSIIAIACLAYAWKGPALMSSQPLNYDKPLPTHLINATWDEFLDDCGGKVIVENYIHARAVFNRKYENQLVIWTGLYAGVKEVKGQTLWGTDHALNLFVKMSPTESYLYPDLMLSVSSQMLNNDRDLLLLNKGDEIRFKARILGMGDEVRMHHLHLVELAGTGEHKELGVELILRDSY
ncbi:hypothetical protein FGO68_gene5664 [Halteria grandinella]|uniref:LITAF domain-containing protein n=1 Tax=Halteria grandinella TaxID=5974 RepID=A0A8J8NJS9_HALGN|nr:hypothetical protein FGO68_gene5664 [Halteria grandinella]